MGKRVRQGMRPTYGPQQVKILSEGTAASKPHGGNLVNRFSNIDPSGLSSISISADLANDVENIADGIFSPLEGFLSQQDFENVERREGFLMIYHGQSQLYWMLTSQLPQK